MAQADWLDAAAIARSATHLADADGALDWAMKLEWKRSVRESGDGLTYGPGDMPAEIRRRIVVRAVRGLATEGESDLRGAELDRLLSSLSEGETVTIRGVLCRGGSEWRFTRAPSRRP
jgi:tRNA(Ile)-lysidine synthase